MKRPRQRESQLRTANESFVESKSFHNLLKSKSILYIFEYRMHKLIVFSKQKFNSMKKILMIFINRNLHQSSFPILRWVFVYILYGDRFPRYKLIHFLLTKWRKKIHWIEANKTFTKLLIWHSFEMLIMIVAIEKWCGFSWPSHHYLIIFSLNIIFILKFPAYIISSI